MSRKKAWFDPSDADRISVNQSDGQKFFGFDDEETGTTAWYDEDGNLDSVTDTPRDYDFSL